MTNLVTGATGFVGAAVARALLARHEPVRALVRPDSDARNLASLDVERVTGDVTVPDSLDAALDGCRWVFHVAADYRLWVPDPDPMYAVNVQGALNVLEAAARAKVERLVYTSSVATLGLRADGRAADEETPVTLADMIGHYKRSKYLAEEAIVARARALGFPLVTVNPSTPIGPGDIRPTPTGRVILDAAAGRMPAYVDTGLNVVHVDDVAQGHLAARDSGAPGERYILGGTDMSLREILWIVATQVGGRAPRVRLPHWLVLPVAHLAEAGARLSGKEPRATVDGVRMATKHMYFSSQKARRELAYRPRPPEAAIADAIAWFREHNYL